MWFIQMLLALFLGWDWEKDPTWFNVVDSDD